MDTLSPTVSASAGAGLDALRQLLAARKYAEVLAAGDELLSPQQGLSGTDRAQVLLSCGRALAQLQRPSEATERYDYAQELYAEAGDEEGVNRCKLAHAVLRRTGGSLSEGQYLAAQVREAAQAHGWVQLAAEALLLEGLILNREHKYREALGKFSVAEPYFSAHPEDHHLWDWENGTAWARIGNGELAEGQVLARRVYARLTEQGAPVEDRGTVLNTLTFYAWCAGDFVYMLDKQQQLVALFQADAPPRQLMFLLYNSAVCEAQLGRYGAAKRSLNRAWAIARRMGESPVEPAILMLLSLTALHEDRPDMALEYAELARTNAREFESDEAVLIGWYVALAQLGAGRLDLAQAEWSARQALEPSIENWLELGLLRTVLARLADPGFAPEQPLDDVARALATAWGSTLVQLQATYPAPPALAAAQT